MTPTPTTPPSKWIASMHPEVWDRSRERSNERLDHNAMMLRCEIARLVDVWMRSGERFTAEVVGDVRREHGNIVADILQRAIELGCADRAAIAAVNEENQNGESPW